MSEALAVFLPEAGFASVFATGPESDRRRGIVARGPVEAIR